MKQLHYIDPDCKTFAVVVVESTQNVTFKEHTSNICAVEIKNLHY